MADYRQKRAFLRIPCTVFGPLSSLGYSKASVDILVAPLKSNLDKEKRGCGCVVYRWPGGLDRRARSDGMWGYLART